MRLQSLLCSGAAILFCFSLGLASSQQQSKQPKKNAEEPKKKRLVADLSGFELQDPGKMRAENTKLGATRGGLQPQALAPRRAKFYGASALFAWKYEGKATRFAVVFNDEDDNEVFHAEATGKEYRLPPKAYRFQPGKIYSWSVATAPPMIGANPSEPVEFVVLSDAERAEIEKALAAIPKGDEYKAGLAFAKVLTDHRLWFDVIGAYTELIAKFPDRAELYEARGAVYHALKATQPLADADFARADELKKSEAQGRRGPSAAALPGFRQSGQLQGRGTTAMGRFGSHTAEVLCVGCCL